MKRGKFVLLSVFLFVVAFGAGYASKSSLKVGWQKEYELEWSDSIGTKLVDLSYGDGASNKYDLYLPHDNSKETYGLVVYLHPGGFTEGDKADTAGIMTWLTAKGYVAAGINYTLMTESNGKNVYTQSMEIKEAIPLVIEEARKQGYTIAQMAVAGESAGHALAMIYAYRDAAEAPVPVKLLFGTCGPSSFYLDDWDIFGVDIQTKEGRELGAKYIASRYSGEEITEEMVEDGSYLELVKPISAVMYVNENTVPSVVSYGAYDKAQPYKGALRLQEAYQTYGVDYQFFVGEHSGHGLQNDAKVYKEYLDCAAEYLANYLPVE